MATTKRTKTTNKPSLKSQGAGYSTTNRKGETTYYKSSKDAPGYTDTFQGKGTMSKGNAPISRVDSKGAVLATNIGTTSPVIPPKPEPTDTGDMLGMNNASVLQEGLTLDGGKFVKDPNASDVMNATKEANVNMGNIASQVLGYLQPQENQMQNAYEDTYGITSRQAGREYRAAQNEVQQYTSQLNNITANRDASILALEDTGRGQTTGFIGGEQGRIQRQAAIAALPVQAQLAAAQGNLEIAKSHVDSLFQMKIKDIETEQAYKQTVANTWMSVATTQQSNLLNAAIADSNERAEAKKIAMNDAKQIAMQAIEYGQSSLAASVMKLDPTSPTYQQDVMNAMAGLRKPVEAVAQKAPEMQNFGTADNPDWRQYDYGTGTWKEVDGVGVGTGSSLSKVQKAKVSEAVVANEALYKDISEYKTLLDEVGFEGSTWGATNLGKFDALRGRITTTLKKAEALGTLDAGVLQLVNQLIGQAPEKSGLTQNIGGFASKRVSSSLDTQLRLIQDRINTDKERLGGNQLQFQPLEEDTTNEIYRIFGVSQSTNNGTFDPDEWLN